MSFIKSNQPSKFRWNTLVVVEIAAIAAIIWFMARSSGGGSAPSSPVATPSFFQKHGEAPRVRPVLAPTPARPTTDGLAFVVRDDQYSLKETPGANGSGAAGAAAPSGAPRAPGAAAPSVAAASPAEMASAGLPADAAGLRNLGQGHGLLLAAVTRLLDHPRLVSAIFNNRLVVDGLMSRSTSQKNCSDPAALAAIISNPQSKVVTSILPVVQAVLARPDTAAAFAGSEMATRLAACPSVSGLANSPAAVVSIAQSNPEALTMLSDPRVIQAVGANPPVQTLFNDVQSNLGGSAGAPNP
jgi:hypothetical protein